MFIILLTKKKEEKRHYLQIGIELAIYYSQTEDILFTSGKKIPLNRSLIPPPLHQLYKTILQLVDHRG